MAMVDVEIKTEFLNFEPLERNEKIQIKTEGEDPLHPFTEGYYFVQCKCSVLVKRSDKSVQCNLYEEQMESDEISFSNVKEGINNNIIDKHPYNNDDCVAMENITYNDNDDTADNMISYSSISESSSEDESKFDAFFGTTEKAYDEAYEAYTMVDGGYKCNKCDKILDTLRKFVRHSVSHLEYSRLCQVCGKTFNRNISYHLQICPYLNKGKAEENDLNEEKKSKEPSWSKKKTQNGFQSRECKDCGQKIKSILEGYDHQNIHKKLKPYHCSCGSKCRHFHNFIIHLKKFKCPVDKCIIPKYAPQNLQLWIDREPNQILRRTATDLEQSGTILRCEKEKKNITVEAHNSKSKSTRFKLPDSELNCKECGIDKFKNYVRYREHLEVKHLERKFECKDKRCGRKFATERRLRDHVKMSHISYKCEKCNFVFPRNRLRKHNLSCSGLKNEKVTVKNYKTTFRNQLFYCSICNEQQQYKKIKVHFEKDYHKILEKTWKEKHNIKEYKCTKCNDLKELPKNSIYQYFMHLVNKHNYCFVIQINDIFKSFENNEPFIFNDDIEDSKLTNITVEAHNSKSKSTRFKLPDSELNCKECGIDKFVNYVRYREHLEVKHLERKFDCKHKRCVRKFATERRLREHVKMSHISYKCEKCNFVFPRYRLRKHNLSCSGLKNEKVTVKNYKTTFRYQLFHCSICNEQQQYKKIKVHFEKDYHKILEKTWKEKHNIKEYKCTKCNDLKELPKNSIYQFFMHLVNKHNYCFVIQINDIFKSFENNEPFIFNDDIEDSKLTSVVIDS